MKEPNGTRGTGMERTSRYLCRFLFLQKMKEVRGPGCSRPPEQLPIYDRIGEQGVCHVSHVTLSSMAVIT